MFNTGNQIIHIILQTSIVTVHLVGYLVLTETCMMLLSPTLHRCGSTQIISLKLAKHLQVITDPSIKKNKPLRSNVMPCDQTL